MPKKPSSDRQSDDGIIDRYLPDASPEERERAGRELKGIAGAVFGVFERVEQERRGRLQSDSSLPSSETTVETQ